MRLFALVLLLLGLPAWADDAPRKLRAFPVQPGYVVTEPGIFYTDEGNGRVAAKLQADAQRIAQLEAEKAALEKVPALTPGGVVLLLAVGIVAGAAATTAVILAVSSRP